MNFLSDSTSSLPSTGGLRPEEKSLICKSLPVLSNENDEGTCNDETFSLPFSNVSNDDIPLLSFSGGASSSHNVRIPPSSHLNAPAPPVEHMVEEAIRELRVPMGFRLPEYVPIAQMVGFDRIQKDYSLRLFDFLSSAYDETAVSDFNLLNKISKRFFTEDNGYSKSDADHILHREHLKDSEQNQLVDAHNRWADIRPWGYNAVTLYTPIWDDNFKLDVEYVNASPIELDGQQFIATSAPQPSSFAHYWRMIFEQGSDTVVALTKFLENRRVKAHCYWPSKVGQNVNFEGVNILCTLAAPVSDHVMVREFDLSYNGAERMIRHFHYTGWPDMGRPDNTEEFINLMVHVGTSNQSGPIVTHCSAGCGRVGTFITAYSYSQKIIADLNEGVPDDYTVNLPIRVLKIREQRPDMVQRPEQYQFIQEVISQIIINHLGLAEVLEDQDCVE